MKRILSLAVLFVAGAAMAQLYPSKLGISGAMSLRLSEPRWQSELKINDEQAKKIQSAFDALVAAQNEMSAAISKAKPEQYAAIQLKQEKAEKESANKILAALSVVQKNRLLQIGLQDAGPFALRNADVAKKIGLNNDQRLKVNAIATKTIATLDEMHAKVGEQMAAAPQGKNGDKKRTAIMKSFEPKLKQIETMAEKQVLSILTPAQAQSWKKALGTPFTP